MNITGSKYQFLTKEILDQFLICGLALKVLNDTKLLLNESGNLLDHLEVL